MRKLLAENGYPAGDYIPAYAQTDDGFKALLRHDASDGVRALAKARVANTTWPKHIKRIENMRIQSDASDGLLRIPLNYYGGHTGRWSGGGKINVQNLGGRGRAGKGTHTLIRAMRGLITVPEEMSLVQSDSAQIEARVLAWLAGELKLIEGFANGEDIYSEFATALFKSPVRKKRATDPPLIQAMLDLRRGFGKDAILGCGYGMGGNRFYERCLENDALRPYFDDGTYNFEFIDKLIKLYRSTYTCIPKFWRNLESAVKSALAFPRYVTLDANLWQKGQVTDSSNNEPPNAFGRLTIHRENALLWVRLPSGRKLYYRNVVVRDGQIKGRYGPLWGGVFVENIVQAVARDLLAFWIKEIEDVGLSVVMHVHDEVILLVGEGDAPAVKDCVLEIMRTVPAWAEGLPVDAEAEITKVYKK